MIQMFEDIMGKKQQQKKDLEKDRYLQAQLHLLQSKLQRLERIFSVGMPLGEAEETIERLDKIERGVKITGSKINMFASVMKELKEGQEKIQKSLDSKAGINQLQIISQRIKFLENIYGELSSSKTKDIFMNIVDILRSLETRIKTLEGIANRNVRLMFKEEIKQVKDEAGTKGKELPPLAATAKGQKPSGLAPAEVIEEEGIGARVKGFFRKLLGRK